MSDIEKGVDSKVVAESDNSWGSIAEGRVVDEQHSSWWRKYWASFVADFTETRGVQRVLPEERQPVSSRVRTQTFDSC